jgi:hypothetical protein
VLAADVAVGEQQDRAREALAQRGDQVPSLRMRRLDAQEHRRAEDDDVVPAVGQGGDELVVADAEDPSAARDGRGGPSPASANASWTATSAPERAASPAHASSPVIREVRVVDEVVLEDERRIDEEETGHRATAAAPSPADGARATAARSTSADRVAP